MPVFTVTTLTDDAGIASNCTNQAASGATLDAACSLRDAIAAATAVTAANELPTVNFSTSALGISAASPGAYSVATNGTLHIARNVKIAGPGANLLSISGGGAVQVFNQTSGITATLSGVTITAGFSSGDTGGGIYDDGTLTLSNCVVSGNSGGSVGAGGGIYNKGTLTVSNCTFSNNSAVLFGGAIYSYGSLTVAGSTFTNNSAQYGAGISAGGSSLTVTDSTFSGNTTSQGGGAILSSSTATVTNSTFSGNTSSVAAGGQGGAIFNVNYFGPGLLTVTNSIFFGNTAWEGGGIYNQITANAADNVFYNNLGNGSENDCNGCTSNAGAVSGNPLLAPLANYGGPTQTMLPLPGSAAICAGAQANETAAGLTTDQRGYPDTNSTYPGYSSSNACADAGAVQTRYGLAFSTEPPAIVAITEAIAPAPVVWLTESGATAVAANSSVTMTDSASLLGGTTSASLSSGSAAFTNLVISSVTGSDKLKAALALNPELNLTAQSSSFQAVSPSGPAKLASPAPGSTLTGPSATFTWTPSIGASGYSLWLGTTGAGSSNLYDSRATSGTSVTVGRLPTNGATIYARINTIFNGVSVHTDFTYTAVSEAVLTLPAPSSVLAGASVTFIWTPVAGATAYSLWLGSTGTGSSNLFDSGARTGTSIAVARLPANGETIYARINTIFNGVSVHTDFTYTASTQAANHERLDAVAHAGPSSR
jgi:predicted outer membrane repeat protein